MIVRTVAPDMRLYPQVDRKSRKPIGEWLFADFVTGDATGGNIQLTALPSRELSFAWSWEDASIRSDAQNASENGILAFLTGEICGPPSGLIQLRFDVWADSSYLGAGATSNNAGRHYYGMPVFNHISRPDKGTSPGFMFLTVNTNLRNTFYYGWGYVWNHNLDEGGFERP